ncbi:hypothetical protein MJ560_01985 [Klebsiella pneumoniae]|nr:hypothetical protein MJ560_01985 [Klebsiella pneumoniae]
MLQQTRRVIRGIDGAYFEAGADIIKDNTQHNSTTIAMADCTRWNPCRPRSTLPAAKLARASLDALVTDRTPEKPRYVVGRAWPDQPHRLYLA